MARFVAVADTDAEAEAIARTGTQFLTKTYMTRSNANKPESPDQRVLTMDPEDKIARYLDSVVIHGSPSKVVDKIHQLRERMHLDYLMCAPLSHASFTAFTEQVLPKFL